MKHTREDTIRTLERLRDENQSQLDTSIVTELNTLIADLRKADDEEQNSEQRKTLSMRVLQVIGVVVSLVTNLKELMK